MTTLQKLSEAIPQLPESDRLALLEQVEAMLRRQRGEETLKRRMKRLDQVSRR